MAAETTYHLVSLGCAKNRVDSENIMGLLGEQGFILTPDPAKAAVIIVNTCGFIGPARKESVEEILRMAEYKKEGCRALLVAGCMPARHKLELIREIPQIDGLVTPATLHEISRVLARCLAGQKTFCLKGREGAPLSMPRQLAGSPHSVYLKIADGCNHRCTFCVIPRLRGTYRSRPLEDLVSEAEGLVSLGARELNLVAQDTTFYGQDLYGEKKLPQLLERLARIPDVRWLRILYAHPLHVDAKLLRCMHREEKVCAYLDIPLQHASPQVLKAMGRGLSPPGRVLETCRSTVPGLVLRSTFIVGFPGERSRHYQELLAFLDQHRIERVGVFKYSPEEGTPSAGHGGQVPGRVKEYRYHRTMSSLKSMSLARNRQLEGKELQVMVDRQGEDGRYLGRYWGQAPEVDGIIRFRSSDPLTPGELVDVRITKALEYDLEGENSR